MFGRYTSCPSLLSNMMMIASKVVAGMGMLLMEMFALERKYSPFCRKTSWPTFPAMMLLQGAFFDWSHQKVFEDGKIPTKKVKVEQSNSKM